MARKNWNINLSTKGFLTEDILKGNKKIGCRRIQFLRKTDFVLEGFDHRNMDGKLHTYKFLYIVKF